MSYILVDANSIGYASQSAKPLSVDGREVQAIYNTLRTIAYIRENYTSYQTMVVLWDGRAQWRYDLYPEYKGNRSDTPDKIALKAAYQDQVPDIRAMLNSLGVIQARSPLFEADDLAGFFVRRALVNGKQVKLVTGDRDWLQLVHKNVSWMDPRSKETRHCDFDTFSDYTGYASPSQFLSAKAIVGDTSDNIKGVYGLGDKSALGIMQHFGSVHAMVKTHREKGDFLSGDLPKTLNRVRIRLNEFCTNAKGDMDIYRRNVKLMNLCSSERDAEMEKSLVIERGGKNMVEFQKDCARLNFFSILREVNRWGNLF